VRSVGRFGIIAYLCICLLAGFGFRFLKQTNFFKNISNHFSWLLLGLLLAFVIIEFKSTDFPFHPPIPTAKGKIYEDLAALPGKEAVIALPFSHFYGNEARFAAFQTQYMHLLQETGRPMMNGYSGKIPEFHTKLYSWVKNFPDEKSMAYLGSIVGLRYVVFHSSNDAVFHKEAFERKLTLFRSQLRLIRKDPMGNYLLKLQPVIRVDDLELLLPPDPSKERHLTFQLCWKPPILDSPQSRRTERLRISVTGANRKSNTEYVSTLSDIVMDQISEWIDADITVPKSIDPVLPYSLKLKIRNNARNGKVLIRNISISSIESRSGGHVNSS